MSKLIDLTGKRFNRLLVLERTEKAKGRKSQWICKCDCGNKCIVSGSNLNNGHTQSCGCLRIERLKNMNTTHGKCYTSTHHIWTGIKQRCCNPKNPAYKDYGGRGITICERWKYSFQFFYDDVSKLQHYGEKGYTLDRIDNGKGYELSNVRWATAKEQSNNRRSNDMYLVNGRYKNLKQLAEEYGIDYKTLHARIKRGWNIKRALTTNDNLK